MPVPGPRCLGMARGQPQAAGLPAQLGHPIHHQVDWLLLGAPPIAGVGPATGAELRSRAPTPGPLHPQLVLCARVCVPCPPPGCWQSALSPPRARALPCWLPLASQAAMCGTLLGSTWPGPLALRHRNSSTSLGYKFSRLGISSRLKEKNGMFHLCNYEIVLLPKSPCKTCEPMRYLFQKFRS